MTANLIELTIKIKFIRAMEQNQKKVFVTVLKISFEIYNYVEIKFHRIKSTVILNRTERTSRNNMDDVSPITIDDED